MSRKSSGTENYRRPSSGGRTTAITVICCLLAIILVAVILIASISTCNLSKSVDPHYKGDRTILSSFDAVREDYPDTEMADRIAGLAAEEQQENLDIAYSVIHCNTKMAKTGPIPNTGTRCSSMAWGIRIKTEYICKFPCTAC